MNVCGPYGRGLAHCGSGWFPVARSGAWKEIVLCTGGLHDTGLAHCGSWWFTVARPGALKGRRICVNVQVRFHVHLSRLRIEVVGACICVH